MIPQLTDEQLIDSILKEQSNELFSILFQRYRDKVLGKCYSMTKNTTVSEDLVQDIMLKGMEKLHQFKGKSSFSTWLYQITYNTCIDYLRLHKRIKFDDWESSLDIPEEVSEEELEDILRLKSERLQLLLEMLKPEDKAILLMKYKEGYDLKRIMVILNISGESATKMRLNRAKKRLVAFYNQLYSAIDEA